MSFSKQPVNSTYTTKVVNLAKELGSRGTTTSRDSYLLNCYAEMQKNKDTQEKELNIVKRSGSFTVFSSVDSGGIRGGWLWKDQKKLFVCILDKLYIYNTDTTLLITSISTGFGTTSGDVGFDEFLYDDTTTKLVVSDGTTLITVDTSNGVAPAVGIPVHEPHIVFFDGVLYVVKSGTSSIYNSDDNNPLAWTGGDFIDAEMRADLVKRIALLNNYLVAFGSKTVEYFYDAANASGSPLSRNDSPMKAVGYVGGFTKYGNKVFFVGETSEGQADVYMLEDFKMTPLGNEAVRRNLAVSFGTILGAVVSFNGHDFYVMTTNDATFALELENKLWSKWSYKSGTTFPINFSLAQNSDLIGYRNFFTTTLDQSINRFLDTSGTDHNSATFPMEIVSDNEYFDSYNRKTCPRLTIYADKPASSVGILVQTSDDDYQTWSTGQTIELFQEMPCGYRWGQFRRRAHKLSYTGAQPVRIMKLELDLNLGNS